MNTNTSPLFAPFRLGAIALANCFAMAPLTRNRAGAAPARSEGRELNALDAGTLCGGGAQGCADYPILSD